MLDLHLHILPGVDDGARTLAASVELARAVVADGVELAAATPHVRDDYPTRPDQMERLVREVRSALAEVEVPLDVRPGAEIALEWLPALAFEELRRFALAGNPEYLLVEFPFVGWPLALGGHVAALRARGVVPVLAHPERNRDVSEAPERLRPLVENGALVQLTAASLDGRLGPTARATAFDLLDRGLAHVLASDAHGPEIRAAGMSSAVRALGDEELGRWLTVDMPAAIVAGRPLPPRPTRRRPARWLARLRRARRSRLVR